MGTWEASLTVKDSDGAAARKYWSAEAGRRVFSSSKKFLTVICQILFCPRNYLFLFLRRRT